jgi:hypothetical protein
MRVRYALLGQNEPWILKRCSGTLFGLRGPGGDTPPRPCSSRSESDGQLQLRTSRHIFVSEDADATTDLAGLRACLSYSAGKIVVHSTFPLFALHRRLSYGTQQNIMKLMELGCSTLPMSCITRHLYHKNLETGIKNLKTNQNYLKIYE